MTAQVGGTAVLLVGAMLVRLALTGAYLKYVRAGMGPFLLVAGVLLVCLGLVAVVRGLRGSGDGAGPQEHDEDADHGEDHHHVGGDRVGWLLIAPVVALLLVTPPALGSYAVDRSATVTVAGGTAVFDPLPAGSAPREMRLFEVRERGLDRGGASFAGRTVSLTGFVARERDGEGFRLARYQIACCAADAVSAVVRVVAPAGGPLPPLESWVTVSGTFRAMGADGVPELVADRVTPVPMPVDPYE